MFAEAIGLPKVSPMKTMEPSHPNCILFKSRSSCIRMAAAGITPWSKFISKFRNKTTKNKLAIPDGKEEKKDH